MLKLRERTLCCCCNTELPSTAYRAGSLSSSATNQDLKNGWIGVGRSPFFSYYKCAECGTLNVKEYPSEEDIGNLYASMPPNMSEAVSPTEQANNQKGYAKTVASNLDTGKTSLNILEIGADCGHFCSALNDLLPGRLHNIHAVEPNLDVHPKLESALQPWGRSARIHEYVDEALTSTSTALDIVIGIHVFDHIFELDDLFARLRTQLSEDGVIFLVVHNPASTVARILGERWPAFCAQHPQLFTSSGITRLASKHSLRLMHTGRTLNSFSLEMVTGYFGVQLPDFANKRTIRFPLGNRYYFLQHGQR